MMAYHANIHRAQMAASEINEQLLMAMGSDTEHTRTFHVKAALVSADTLFDRLITLRRELAGLSIAEAA